MPNFSSICQSKW